MSINSQQIANEMRHRGGHSAAGGPPQPTRLSESIVRMEEALHHFQRECERAESMADRLLGPTPKEDAQMRPAGALTGASGGSIADQIESLAARLLSTRERLTFALERLQQL